MPACKNLPVSTNLNVLENDYGNWISTSFLMITTALIFFKLAENKKMGIEKNFVALICNTLLIVTAIDPRVNSLFLLLEI